MEVTAAIKRAAVKTATPMPAVVDYRSAYSHWLAGFDADGTGQVSGCRAARVERPSVIVMVIDSGAASTVWVQPEPSALLVSQCQGSAGIVSVSSDYGPLLPHVGSSPLIVDRRSMQRPAPFDARLSVDGFEAVSVPDKLKELQAALSLNKSQLARIMRVSRPTIYEWYEGKDPDATNSERIRTLLRVLKRSAASGAMPLNARFVRQPTGPAEPSLLDLLCEYQLDQARVVRALKRARDLGGAELRKRKNREDRLRALGFEDPSGNQRKEQLARNVALQDWPKR